MNAKIATCAALTLLATACTNTEPSAPPPELQPSLRAYVLDEVPSDVDNRTFVDFGGKVHLIGYKIEPSGIVRPGQSVKMTLYWRSVAPLTKGWRLFTHLTSPGGSRLENFDKFGPLREPNALGDQSLPPDQWQLGKVYVDEQNLTLPGNITDPVVTLTVGIWRGNARLDILSGRSDGTRRAIIANIPTGVVPPKPVAKKEPSKP
ncbi:MAG: hypothetical protein R3B13_40170 [Polyangiaceae bacterium]